MRSSHIALMMLKFLSRTPASPSIQLSFQDETLEMPTSWCELDFTKKSAEQLVFIYIIYVLSRQFLVISDKVNG